MRQQSRQFVLLVALATALPTSMARGDGSAARGEAPRAAFDEPVAQIQFSSPTWYAIVLHRPTKARVLYTRNDVIVDVRHARQSWTIERVDPGILVVREHAGSRPHSLRLGNTIPGFSELWFTGTVKLDQLYFRYKPVEQPTRADPVLIAIEGSRAILEVEVARSSASTKQFPPAPEPRKLDPALFEKVRVKKVGAHAYEIPAADAKPVLENVGQMFAALKPTLLPTFSQQTGMSWYFTSAVADGMLSQGGFTVTNLKVAQFLGIEVGDTIFSINGHPVTSPLNAYWAYQETIARNPLLSELRVDLNRSGVPLTKTYQIR
jgi:hypothetical protein